MRSLWRVEGGNISCFCSINSHFKKKTVLLVRSLTSARKLSRYLTPIAIAISLYYKVVNLPMAHSSKSSNLKAKF